MLVSVFGDAGYRVSKLQERKEKSFVPLPHTYVVDIDYVVILCIL